MLMDTSGTKEDFYTQEHSEAVTPGVLNEPSTSISWSASEFLYHQKSASWYLIAAVILVVLSALLYLLTADYIGPISVIILGALLLVGASRKPRTVQYVIDDSGVIVGTKEYAYDDFQSFSIVKEDQIESVALFPHKRLSPVISLYFAPDDGQRVFDLLSSFLPFEQKEKDQIDKFLHKIKF